MLLCNAKGSPTLFVGSYEFTDQIILFQGDL